MFAFFLPLFFKFYADKSVDIVDVEFCSGYDCFFLGSWVMSVKGVSICCSSELAVNQ